MIKIEEIPHQTNLDESHNFMVKKSNLVSLYDAKNVDGSFVVA